MLVYVWIKIASCLRVYILTSKARIIRRMEKKESIKVNGQ